MQAAEVVCCGPGGHGQRLRDQFAQLRVLDVEHIEQPQRAQCRCQCCDVIRRSGACLCGCARILKHPRIGEEGPGALIADPADGRDLEAWARRTALPAAAVKEVQGGPRGPKGAVG